MTTSPDSLNRFQITWLLIFLAMTCSFALKVGDFAARPHVQRALKEAKSSIILTNPMPVLTFFFGVNYEDPYDVEFKLKQGGCLHEMEGIWFRGGEEYDALCQPFRETVRAAGSGKLNYSPWSDSVEGLLAQMLLCDQLSRNIFRGTPEVFAYDKPALAATRTLCKAYFSPPGDNSSPIGEVYPAYISFLLTSLSHSEDLADHDAALTLLDHASKSPCGTSLENWWQFARDAILDHRQVIEKFGRYPHRNRLYRRRNTPEEEKWLANKDALPGWAKSQMVEDDDSDID